MEVLLYLDKVISNHITNSPRLVSDHGLERLQKVGLALFRGQLLCDSNKVSDSQQTNRVLLILRQLVEEGDHIRDKMLLAELLGKCLEITKSRNETESYRHDPNDWCTVTLNPYTKMCGGSTTDHRRVV